MYFFTEKSRQLASEVENYEDIYVSTVQDFYDKYQLPELHLWEDGFVRGDSSDEEIIESFQKIDSMEKESMTENHPFYHEPIAHAFYDEDGDLQASDYFEWLDNKFLEMLEEKCEGLKFESVSFSSLQWEDKERVCNVIRCSMEEIKDGYSPDFKLFLNHTTDELKVCDTSGNLIDKLENVEL